MMRGNFGNHLSATVKRRRQNMSMAALPKAEIDWMLAIRCRRAKEVAGITSAY
jgi:hypothetical protein